MRKKNIVSQIIQSSLDYFRVELKPSVNIIITIFSASATIAQIVAISQTQIIVILAIFNQAISFAMEGIDKDFLTTIGFEPHCISPPLGELPIYCRTFNILDVEEIVSSIENYKTTEVNKASPIQD